MNIHMIDGKGCAAALRSEVAEKVRAFKGQYGITPGLAVVLVGTDSASEIYVSSKGKMCREVGMESFDVRLSDQTTQEELLQYIDALNQNKQVHGILVQLPLPKHINERVVIDRVDPLKDVDGFHIINAGKLATGENGMIPCTPLGCLHLIKSVLSDLKGKYALVIGRSNIVGKPMAQLLLREHCTVTIAHSRTRELPALCKMAHIVVAAIGQPEFVKGNWLKEGSVIIDVGMNRISLSDGRKKLVGDVAFAEAAQRAMAITPVPGGVGPMTIAYLLANTLKAAQNQCTL